MPPIVATCLFGAFVLWLFVRDAKTARRCSNALWIPIAWAFIVGSKPASLWLGTSGGGGEEFAEDGPLDKGLFLFLIVAGFSVLVQRRMNWRWIYQQNKWLFFFFFYLAVSVVWADDPLVSIKRWVKDAGNIVMVLLILGEEHPLEAVKVFLVRCAYLMIPLSVLLVKYYPTISIQYQIWTGEAFCAGITTNKNCFGMTLSVCGLSLIWIWLEARDAVVRAKDKTALIAPTILLLMTIWLLPKAKSSTAITCLALGAGILLAMRIPAIRKQINRLEAITVGTGVLTLFLQMSGLWDSLSAAFAGAVGRDPSFHGRTIIWAALLKQDINPLFGAGFYSFWSIERMQKLSEGYHYLLNESHNGYLETYLNSGLVGLILLIVVFASAAKRIKMEVFAGAGYGAFRLAFLVIALFYGMSEAIFNRLSLLWLVLLLAVMEFPRRLGVRSENGRERLRENARQDSVGSSAAVSSEI